MTRAARRAWTLAATVGVAVNRTARRASRDRSPRVTSQVRPVSRRAPAGRLSSRTATNAACRRLASKCPLDEGHLDDDRRPDPTQREHVRLGDPFTPATATPAVPPRLCDERERARISSVWWAARPAAMPKVALSSSTVWVNTSMALPGRFDATQRYQPTVFVPFAGSQIGSRGGTRRGASDRRLPATAAYSGGAPSASVPRKRGSRGGSGSRSPGAADSESSRRLRIS